jgi:hypothetical protein
MYIMGDLGGKVIILGADSMGHCEKKMHINVCVIMNAYRNRAV